MDHKSETANLFSLCKCNKMQKVNQTTSADEKNDILKILSILTV